MKRLRRRMADRAGSPAWVLVVLLALAPAAWCAPSPLAEQPAGQDAAGSAPDLRKAGMEAAFAGRFERALEEFRKAAKLEPTDVPTRKAVELLTRHVALQTRFQAERQAEYAEAVRRVEVSMIAQRSQPAPEKQGLYAKLRSQIQDEVSPVFDVAGTGEGLTAATPDEARKMVARAVEAIDKARKGLAQAVKLLQGRTDEFAKQFGIQAKELARELDASAAVWKAAKLDTSAAREEFALAIEDRSLELGNAVGDVEMMVTEKPWRSALAQGKLAKLLAADEKAFYGEEWLKRLRADVEARGEADLKAERWYDAISAYAGLNELYPDDEHYDETLKLARKHVRVLGLYGQQPATQPATGPSRRTRWEEMVVGVDAKMVEKAISQLDQYYVAVVDYRKVTRGALSSIRVLAETAEAAHSFAGLKDKGKKQEFLDTVARLMQSIEKKDRVDHLDLQLTLNGVLHASERTVEIPTEVIVVEFAEGFLDELDRFSSIIWPFDAAEFRKQTIGRFRGVGIQITKQPGEPLKVVSPLADSPAFRAGIKAGDLIVAVDGQATKDIRLNDLINMIMGEKGTKVVLTVKRAGTLKPIDIPVIRDEIHIRTVKGWQRQPGGKWYFVIDEDAKIGYLRLTQFTKDTPADVAEALGEMRKLGLRSLVLDLRFNPGGMLQAATIVANQFLRLGRIVSTRGRQTGRSELRADNSGLFLDGEMAVLVNGQSASASEIVSGALKDWHRAVIIGGRTYGKGSVQNVIRLRGQDAMLKLTTAYYYLPSGRLLHRRNGAKDWGVNPDVDTVVTPQQMRRRLEILRRTDLLREVKIERLREDLTKQCDADMELQAALLLLRLKNLQAQAGAAAAATAARDSG